MTTLECLGEIAAASQSKKQDRSIQAKQVLRNNVGSGLGSGILDFSSALLAGLLAFQFRFDTFSQGISEVFRRSTPALPATSLAFLLLFGFYLVGVSRIVGLYDPSPAITRNRQLRAEVQAVLGAGLLLCGTLYLTREYVVSREVVLGAVALTHGIVSGRRWLADFLHQRRCLRGFETRNVLIVGSGRVAHALRNHLDAFPHFGFRFKGFITTEESEEVVGAPEIVGNLQNCLEIARSLFVDAIYFSTPLDNGAVVPLVEQARSMGIEVRVVPHLYDGLAWNAPVEYLGQFPTIPLHTKNFNRSAFVAKRVLDVAVALFALLLAAPVMLVLALLVRLDSEGPVLYKAERIGRKGRLFRCYKFRTMVQNADQLRAQIAHLNERDDVLFKVQKDPRITKIGAKLRKYSLDELPQLFNVLKGDMSLVGPRPPLACEVDKYSLSHLKRLDVLPGITGLWQVQARQDSSFDSYISLDTNYVENWSLLLDLRILFQTASVVVGGTGS